MASVAYGNAVFGMRDIKVTNAANAVQEDLGAAVSMSVVPTYQGGNLAGDDATKSTIQFVIHGEGQFSAGEVSSAALAIMTGVTLTTTGTTPAAKTVLKVNAGQRMPYFRMYGQSYDDNIGDVHVLLYKVKLTALDCIKLENGNWRMTTGSVICLDDGTNGVFQLVQNETALAVPAPA